MQLTGVRCSLSTQHLGHANTYTHAHTHTHTHTHTLSLLCSYVTRSLALHCWCSTWWAVVLPCLPYPSCSWPRPHLRPPRATVMEKTAASLCPSKPRSVSTQRLFMCRVGQNHMYTVYIRYFWQENHQMYGHIRCICTVLANPILCAKRLDAGRCPIIVEKAGSQWFRRCRLSNSCSRRSVAPAASEVAPAASEVAPVASEVAQIGRAHV